jgi:hypothetical protein
MHHYKRFMHVSITETVIVLMPLILLYRDFVKLSHACRMLWSMPNLASLLLEGLQAQQLPLLHHLQQQQQQQFYKQQQFLFPQTGLAARGPSWGQPGLAQQQPFQAPPGPHASPLALLAAAAQIAGCTVNA